MKLKHLSKIFILLIIAVVFVVPTVYASWTFAGDFMASVDTNLDLSIKEFEFAPEEVLPDEDQNQFKQNHMYLIENILNHVQYGINSYDKMVIHDYLEDYGAVYGAQNVSGGNLKHVLAADSSVAGGVQFAMKRISDTEYHTFTFAQSELNNTTQGNYLEVYKTVMVYGADANGTVCWHAPLGYKGRAKAAWCETDKKDVYSIDVNSWEKTL